MCLATYARKANRRSLAATKTGKVTVGASIAPLVKVYFWTDIVFIF